jgi:hypothetical protein
MRSAALVISVSVMMIPLARIAKSDVVQPPSQGFGEPRRSSPDQSASGGGAFRPASPAQRGAQAGGGRGNQPPAAARGTVPADGPFDPTGYWVSLVSDEWRYRMLTPAKGNVDYVPVNQEGRRVAQEWDPAKDAAAGEACKAYGPVGIMRLPGRLHLTWQDPNTLKIEIDNGTQTRLLHFGENLAPAAEPPSLQGYSTAQWETTGGRGAPGQPRYGQLKVVTTKMRPGYLRKNGVPYSAGAVLTEYFAHLVDDDGTRYLTVTTMLEDPTYLQQPWVRTSQFKKQPDAKGWNPTPCSAR